MGLDECLVTVHQLEAAASSEPGDLAAMLVALRAANRDMYLAYRDAKRQVHAAKLTFDKSVLALQNQLYEQSHLQTEIRACQRHPNIYQQVRLADTGTHGDMLCSLADELVQRRAMAARLAELQAVRDQMADRTSSARKELELVRDQIKTLIKMASPLVLAPVKASSADAETQAGLSPLRALCAHLHGAALWHAVHHEAVSADSDDDRNVLEDSVSLSSSRMRRRGSERDHRVHSFEHVELVAGDSRVYVAEEAGVLAAGGDFDLEAVDEDLRETVDGGEFGHAGFAAYVWLQGVGAGGDVEPLVRFVEAVRSSRMVVEADK